MVKIDPAVQKHVEKSRKDIEEKVAKILVSIIIGGIAVGFIVLCKGRALNSRPVMHAGLRMLFGAPILGGLFGMAIFSVVDACTLKRVERRMQTEPAYRPLLGGDHK